MNKSYGVICAFLAIVFYSHFMAMQSSENKPGILQMISRFFTTRWHALQQAQQAYTQTLKPSLQKEQPQVSTPTMQHGGQPHAYTVPMQLQVPSVPPSAPIETGLPAASAPPVEQYLEPLSLPQPQLPTTSSLPRLKPSDSAKRLYGVLLQWQLNPLIGTEYKLLEQARTPITIEIRKIKESQAAGNVGRGLQSLYINLLTEKKDPYFLALGDIVAPGALRLIAYMQNYSFNPVNKQQPSANPFIAQYTRADGNTVNITFYSLFEALLDAIDSVSAMNLTRDQKNYFEANKNNINQNLETAIANAIQQNGVQILENLNAELKKLVTAGKYEVLLQVEEVIRHNRQQ